MTCLILVGGAAATTKEGRRCAAVSGRLMTSDDGVVAAKGGVMRDGAVLLAGWQLQQPVMLQTTPRRGSRRWCRGEATGFSQCFKRVAVLQTVACRCCDEASPGVARVAMKRGGSLKFRWSCNEVS